MGRILNKFRMKALFQFNYIVFVKLCCKIELSDKTVIFTTQDKTFCCLLSYPL